MNSPAAVEVASVWRKTGSAKALPFSLERIYIVETLDKIAAMTVRLEQGDIPTTKEVYNLFMLSYSELVHLQNKLRVLEDKDNATRTS